MLGIFIFYLLIYLLIFVVVIIIVGLDNAKRTLQEIVVLPALNPEVRIYTTFDIILFLLRFR